MHQPSGGPVVAAIMPTYNHAAFVGQAIESVLAQTFANWELVVIDDGSTDATLDIVRRFTDPRISVIAREHGGLARLGELYRVALEASTAPLIAILEGDDRWPPAKLAMQVADFEDPSVVLSYGSGWLIDEYGCQYDRVDPPFSEEVRTNRPLGAIVPEFLATNAILSPTVVIRRSTLETVGGFWQPDGVPYLDHPTWLLLAGQGAFAYHSDSVGSWRRHPGQWTTGVATTESEAPELAYVDQVARRLEREGLSATALGSGAAIGREHTERAMLNRWRLALLSAGTADVMRCFAQLLRSGRPRLMTLALMGLAMRCAGSDLEWLQVRRHRVAWPSRRHMRRHR